jgi:hypothetical protein
MGHDKNKHLYVNNLQLLQKQIELFYNHKADCFKSYWYKVALKSTALSAVPTPMYS